MTENLNNENKYSAKLIAKMGMMAAIACVLGLIRFPILPMVGFLTYDFADIPIIISAFAFGPAAVIIITFIVSFIQAFLLGGDQIYGFIMHVISSGTFVLIASLIYKRNKTKNSTRDRNLDVHQTTFHQYVCPGGNIFQWPPSFFFFFYL